MVDCRVVLPLDADLSLSVRSAPVGAVLAQTLQAPSTPPTTRPRAKRPVEPDVALPLGRLSRAQIVEEAEGSAGETSSATAPPVLVTPLEHPVRNWDITVATPPSSPEPPAAPTAELWPDPMPPFTFLCGAAGSGKTFATRAWAEDTHGVELVATTGIAALNLGGTTINGLLGYFDTRALEEQYVNGRLTAKLGALWRAGLRRICLDECSMLSGDQLTYLVRAIEEVNGRGFVLDRVDDVDEDGRAASGGLGLTLIGDLAQLAPVKEPYPFESSEWGRFAAHTQTLTEIRRQADPDFIAALRACRRGEGDRALEYFRDRLQRDVLHPYDGPTLLATNAAVDRLNRLRLSQASGREIVWEHTRHGEQRSEWGNPEKPPYTWGIPPRLHLKIGARVMILANARQYGTKAFVYVNGDLGTIVDGDAYTATVRLNRTGQEVRVAQVRREKLIPADGARRKELRALGQEDQISENGRQEIVGWVQYLPLRLAYASTVHKAQGLSLDQVQVSLAEHFFTTCGMLYVALSRARTAEGLRIVGTPKQFVERCTVDPKLTEWL